MKGFLALSLFVLAGGCAHRAQTSPPITWDTATTINGDRRFSEDSSGHLIYGPSFNKEYVWGQRDAAGNVHADPLPFPQRM